MQVRAAEHREIDLLAKLWYDGWQDAHAALLPAELARARTLGSFRDRLSAALPTVRVTGSTGAPTGLCMTRDDELYQLYVAAPSRGVGVAGALLEDGEARLVAAGVETAWLACAIGNLRAARFYEKHGWQRIGAEIIELDIPAGPFPLEIWRYEKSLARPVGLPSAGGGPWRVSPRRLAG